MASEPKVKTPKQGDHVNITEHEGIFAVYGVNSLMQTASIRSADGNGQVFRDVPWTDLKVLGKK